MPQRQHEESEADGKTEDGSGDDGASRHEGTNVSTPTQLSSARLARKGPALLNAGSHKRSAFLSTAGVELPVCIGVLRAELENTARRRRQRSAGRMFGNAAARLPVRRRRRSLPKVSLGSLKASAAGTKRTWSVCTQTIGSSTSDARIITEKERRPTTRRATKTATASHSPPNRTRLMLWSASSLDTFIRSCG